MKEWRTSCPQEASVLVFLLKKVAVLKACNLIKKRRQFRCFPLNIAEFLRTAIFIEHRDGCFWQPYHSTIKSDGVYVLWFRASTCFRFWSKTYTNVAQIILTITWQNNFFLAWIDWSRAFDFRICFGKTLVAFDYD